MRKVKTPRDARGHKALKTRPTTTSDAVNTGIPPRTVRNIPRGHGVPGMRDTAHIEWEPWEQAVAEMLRLLDGQRLDRANRFYDALERANRLMETVRQRSEEAEEALAYSQSLMDNMQDILMTTSTRGTIMQANPALERISGYSAKELLRKPFANFFTDPERAQAGIEQVIQAGEVSDYDLTLVTKDGQEVPISLNAAVLRDVRGRITRILGTARDMTQVNKLINDLQATSEELEANYEELQATSEELEATNEEMQSTMEELEAANANRQSMMDAMMDILMTTDRQGIITEVNRATERISGYRREELIGQPFRQFFADPDHAQDGIDQVLAEKKVEDYQLIVVTKSGRRVPVSYNATVLRGARRRITGVLGSARDISKIKRVEEENSAVNRDLEMLLHVTSHDLREPLRAIENFSRMVNDQYADKLDERGQDFLRRVVLGSERMTELIDDITALARAQRMEPPTEEVEGELIVQKALERLESRIKETGAVVQVAKDLPRLRVDQTWATEAVYNLVTNALKFTREGAAPEVEIAPYQPAEGEPVGVGIVVRDRGPGVEPEHADRIFDLFQRAVGREVEGTGAGLAIVRLVARRHGGRAWVRPREGGGSEFIITFGT